MSAGWQTHARMMRRVPPAQPVLAAWAMGLAGLLGAAVGAALVGTGSIATAGAVVPMAAVVVRVALRRDVSPIPVGRARTRLGVQALPLLPVSPTQRFWGDFLGNLGASAGWVSLGFAAAMVVSLGFGFRISPCVAVALGAWVMGSLPVSGPRGRVRLAAGLCLLFALLPAAIAGLEPGASASFWVLTALNGGVWLVSWAVLQEPMSIGPGRLDGMVARWNDRAARLDVRPGESAEARLERLAMPALGRQMLVLLAWAAVYELASRLPIDDPQWNGLLELAFIVWLGTAGPEAARGFAGFALGVAPSPNRPRLTTGFLLPLGQRSRLRVTARFALASGMIVPVFGFTALGLTHTTGTTEAVAIAYWASAPFVVIDRLGRGELTPSLPTFLSEILAFLGPCLLIFGIRFPGALPLFFGATLSLVILLPMVVRSVRLALP